MRFLRICVAVAAYLVVGITIVFYILNMGHDVSPVIKCSVNEIEALASATDADLLSYVTASDQEDGDLTDQIQVERGSYFISPGVSKIQYAVADSDNNVTILTKKITYTDYESPKVDLSMDLMFPSGHLVTLKDYMTAEDVFDGDLTSRLKLISTEFTSVAGTYPVNIKVSNRMGDTRDITVDAIVTDSDYYTVRIRLNSYITYAKVGQTPDFRSFVKSISNSASSSYSVSEVRINSSDYNVNQAGVYNVFYALLDENEKIVTMTRLIVVSED